MSNQLFIAQRFLRNERGNYIVKGTCGAQQVVVELDPSILSHFPEGNPERALQGLRTRIQAAARQKWEAGEMAPVRHSFSRRLDYYLIAVTNSDIGLS